MFCCIFFSLSNSLALQAQAQHSIVLEFLMDLIIALSHGVYPGALNSDYLGWEWGGRCKIVKSASGPLCSCASIQLTMCDLCLYNLCFFLLSLSQTSLIFFRLHKDGVTEFFICKFVGKVSYFCFFVNCFQHKMLQL